VPLKKGSALVSEISAVEWDELTISDKYRVDGVVSEKLVQPLLIARAVLNPDGSRMFTDEEATVVAHSSKKPFRALVKAVMRLNGLGGDVVKNSVETATEDSISGSVSTSDTDTQTNSLKD
jgi:hypothetical protein